MPRLPRLALCTLSAVGALATSTSDVSAQPGQWAPPPGQPLPAPPPQTAPPSQTPPPPSTAPGADYPASPTTPVPATAPYPDAPYPQGGTLPADAPSHPGTYPGQPGPAAAQPPLYGQPPGQTPVAAPAGTQPPAQPSAGFHGLTLEAGFGMGSIIVGNDSGSQSAEGVAGFNFGVGWWISPRTSLAGRIAAVSADTSNNTSAAFVFVGPAIQHYIDDDIWLGGGIGVGIVSEGNLSNEAIAVDMRAGYNFWSAGANALGVSVELHAAEFDTVTATGLGLLLNYQFR